MGEDKFFKSKYLSTLFNSNIYLKPQYFSETNSHKDLWASYIIKDLISKNIDKVVVCSAGNLGLALAFQAYKHNIKCRVISWDSLPLPYLKLFKKYSVELKLVNSVEEEFLMLEKAKDGGYFSLNLSIDERKTENLIGVESFKIIAQEISSFLIEKPVDIIVLPVGFGDLAQGILKGFEDQLLKNSIKKLPMFILVRAEFKTGSEASSIVSDITTPQIKEILSKTNSESIFLKNSEFEEGKKLAKEIGLNLELASCGVFSSLFKLNEEEIRDKNIILILTALDR